LFIGLHHIPLDKIDPFIRSLYDSLEPNGVLILREHDAKDERTVFQAHVAHTIFNMIAMNLPETDDSLEFRNFRPLSTWRNVLGKGGFGYQPHDSLLTLQQHGDTTLNTILRFYKPFDPIVETPKEDP